MKDTWIEPESGVWVIEGRSPRIEYSLKVMEEVCGAAMGGLQKLSRGGIEVGGILYGEHAENVVRILAWRQISCEHSKGPAFVLSDGDVEGLTSLLNLEDEGLRGMAPVGWFVSHTKAEIALRHEDREIFERFFPEPWQVTLVLRPARHRGTDAGFFFREADGAMRTASSYKTFSVAAFARLAATPEPGQPATPARRSPSPQRIALNAMAPEGVAEPSLPPARHGARSRWLVALWIILAAGVIGALAYQFYFADRIPALAFRATDTDGQIHVEWDHKSPGIRDAERGVLEITDGGPKVEYPLTADTLRTGGYVYMRHSDDVNLRLTVYRPKKNPLSEGSRFLGQPTSRAFADEIGRLIVERNQVRAEKEDEQKKLEAERARTRLLQQQVRILQQQVDVLRNQIRTQ